MENQITKDQRQYQDSMKACVTLGTIDRLFMKWSARYGGRFTSQVDDPVALKLAKAEWYEELKHLKNEDVLRGINSWKGNWPPNVVEFKKECMPAPCYREWEGRCLPPPKNKEIARTAMKKLKEILS